MGPRSEARNRPHQDEEQDAESGARQTRATDQDHAQVVVPSDLEALPHRVLHGYHAAIE